MKKNTLYKIGFVGLLISFGYLFILPMFSVDAEQTCCPECCSCNDTNCICTDPPLPYCDYLQDPCGEDPEPPCETHSCTLPACPDQTTSQDTGYPIPKLVSCDKGCDEKKYGTCYEIPPEEPPIPPIPCVNGDCTDVKIEFLPDSNKVNELNCQSLVASGTQVNNPVPVKATYSHSIDSDDLETIYFYMTLDGTTPPNIKWVDETLGTSGKALSNSSFGFMLRKVDGNWNQVYLPYIATKNSWKNIGKLTGDFTIDGPTGLPMVVIHDLSISQNDNDVIANFKIEFLYEESGISNYQKIVEKKYDVFGMANDEFGFTPYDNYTNEKIQNKLPYEENEIRFFDHWKNTGEWIVDLVKPSVESLKQVVTDFTEIRVDWITEDAESSIKYVVGNAFRSRDGIVTQEPIEYPSGSGNEFDLAFRGQGDPTGYIGGSNSIWEVANTSVRSESVDIGANRGGSIDLELTAFDIGCNYSSLSDTFNLGEWIESKGGLVFSRGGTNIDVRLLNDGVWSSSQWFEKYGLEEESVDLSTELLAGAIKPTSLLKELRHENSNKSYRAVDYNGIYRSDIYAHYIEKYSKVDPNIITEIVSNGNLSGKLSDYCPGGVNCDQKIYVEKREGNMNIESNFSCDGKAVFLINGDLEINPDIMNSNDYSACIFVVNGDTYIKEGTDKSTAQIGFDTIEAYIVSRGIIEIEKENKNITDIKDGVFVYGGLVAFGKEESSQSSIILKRELSLLDRHIYPVLNVIHQPKYGKLIKQLFGGEKFVFKTELGLKPL